jgi:aldehyde:ferredoxin oxidoreductase
MGDRGKLLDVDLTTGKTVTSDLPEDTRRKVLGGRGLNAWLLYHDIGQAVHPLEPTNELILSCGLLTGTAAPASSRLHLGSKSPLTGLLGSSNVGGQFAVRLRSCGFHCVRIRGRAQRPVYLLIDDGGAHIREASGLWGLDTWETQTQLKEQLSRDFESMVIGPGGENLVLYACVVSDRNKAAGRTGMGAVMGSKKLKAIVVQGKKEKLEIDVPAGAAIKDYVRKIKSSPRYGWLSTLGISGGFKFCNDMGMLGTRNYTSARFEDADKINGEKLSEYVTRRKSCYRCPVHCKADFRIDHGKFAGSEGARPELETVIDLGSKCGLKDPEALLVLANLCNRLGLDTVSTGGAIAFSMDLYDRGILTLDDTGGIDLTWGNAEAMETLIHQIAGREGFGSVLAQGVRQAAQIIGKGSERFAYHTKGLELTGFDPRTLMGTALGYAVSSRGGDFTSVYAIPEYRWSPEKGEKELGSRHAVDRFSTEDKGTLIRRCMTVCAAVDSLGICKVPALSLIGDFDLKNEANLIRLLTGWPIDSSELFRIGERVLNLERLFRAADDRLPERFKEEAADQGPAEGKTVDVEPMVQDFYRSMGWDDEGIPSEKTLKSLGLPEVPPLD